MALSVVHAGCVVQVRWAAGWAAGWAVGRAAGRAAGRARWQGSHQPRGTKRISPSRSTASRGLTAGGAPRSSAASRLE